MKVALLFPGQGVDIAATTDEWYTESARARALLDYAGEHVGMPVDEILSRGARALERSEILQPFVTALSLGICEEVVASGIEPAIVAGHSLGELAAWSAAGGITARTAVEAAAERGRIMAAAALASPGGMAALTACDRRRLQAALGCGREYGVVELAARNAPDEWVVAGDSKSLRAIAGHYGSRALPVAGPWHSSLMAPAVAQLRSVLEALPHGPLRIPVVANRDGRRVEDGDDMPAFVADQLVRPIAWDVTMQTLAGDEITDYVIPGCGKVLRGLVRRNLGMQPRVHLVQQTRDVQRCMETIGS